MSKPFLTAQWRRLALANYVVDPELLLPYLPHGTELDLWKGRCYVSLVGFLFHDTRLKGIRIPMHTTFEEVNLRFYVARREGDQMKRGVAFIQEIVPRRSLTFVARRLFGEPYRTLPMRHNWVEEKNELITGYAWKLAGKWNRFEVRTGKIPRNIAIGSEEEFITEHYWGFTRIDALRTRVYEVKHPRWQVYPMHANAIEVDFSAVYGERFSILQKAKPASVMLAEGSEIAVMSARRIK